MRRAARSCCSAAPTAPTSSTIRGRGTARRGSSCRRPVRRPDGSTSRSPTIRCAARRCSLVGSRSRTSRIAGSSSVSTWTAQTPVVLPPARSRHAIAYDAIHHTAVAFSGEHAGPRAADTWVRDFESAVHPAERCMRATEDSDGDGLAGCADPDCFARCTPMCPPGATCAAGYPCVRRRSVRARRGLPDLPGRLHAAVAR